MFVPFFTVDSELTVIRKMKILFLIKNLKNIDFLFFVFLLLPIFMNFTYYVCILGKNSVFSLFYPISGIFGSNSWLSIWGFLQIFLTVFILILRFWFGRILYLKMKGFESKSLGFKWNRRSRFWFMIFVPGITFSVYRLLFRLTNFEAFHKYNL